MQDQGTAALGYVINDRVLLHAAKGTILQNAGQLTGILEQIINRNDLVLVSEFV